ncbi:MAG: phage terminase small subunit P27 family [Clostridium sp.]|nr:phage terminase small subunit P27 family [Clostridium sp.]
MAKPREPIDLIVAKGKKNLSKKEIEERKKREVKAPSENIQPPLYLPDELKEEFIKIASKLKDIGIISDLDITALGRFLVSEYQYQRVSTKMLKMKNITDKYFDYAILQDKFFKQARAAAGDLGLTISSRCKLVLPGGNEEDNKEKSEGQRRFGNRI